MTLTKPALCHIRFCGEDWINTEYCLISNLNFEIIIWNIRNYSKDIRTETGSLIEPQKN